MICFSSYTYTIATLMADELDSLTGDRPHIIYNQLHRSKLDANREVNEATLNVQVRPTMYLRACDCQALLDATGDSTSGDN